MQMFYARSTGGFYTPEVHGSNIPADAVEISEERHRELMEGQAYSQEIASDENGYPCLVPIVNNIPPYIHSRTSEYPLIEDQLDMLYWDSVNGTENWKAKIAEIKAKYPKA